MKNFLKQILIGFLAFALSILAVTSCTQVGAQITDEPTVEQAIDTLAIQSVDKSIAPIILQRRNGDNRSPIITQDTGYIDLNVRVTAPIPGQSFSSWLMANMFALVLFLLSIVEIIVRWTPTEKDNANLKWLRNILYFLFGNRNGLGGNFPN